MVSAMLTQSKTRNPESAMKLLVFAHVPPPHHGQSYMVQLMMNGFGGDHRRNPRHCQRQPLGDHHDIQCYHVNVRLSKSLEDIGEFQGWKLVLLLYYCIQAICCRFRYGVKNFYYIPAPGKRSALYRDWLVLLICRPFFKRTIFHWHAAGLAKWLETNVQIRSRSLTYRALRSADVSMVLSRYNEPDAEKLFPRRLRIVPNGIPDPCPQFERSVLPRRNARHNTRLKLLSGEPVSESDRAASGGDPENYRVLYLAHCMREKGLFDALEGVARANAELVRSGSPVRMSITIAGEFVDSDDRKAFDQRIVQPDLFLQGRSVVDYVGFAGGAAKWKLFNECDCFCFPTYYYAESFGLVVIEAMSCGLAVVASAWRTIPELMTENYAGLVPPRSPDRIAKALIELVNQPPAVALREHFLKHFTVEQHLKKLAAAIHDATSPQPDTATDCGEPSSTVSVPAR
jgi:glycosyltransferase involved in cell wall biosynthesis